MKGSMSCETDVLDMLVLLFQVLVRVYCVGHCCILRILMPDLIGY